MSKRVQVFFDEPSLTKQSFQAECDVNEIMRRFVRSGDPNVLNRLQAISAGVYGDFSNVGDYRSALDQVRRADEVFMAMPAKVRAEFHNDAAIFLDFCSDPKNLDRLRELGLAKPKVEQKSPSETVVEK